MIVMGCVVVSFARSAVADAATARPGTYVGLASNGGGLVLIAVAPGGRTLTSLSIENAASINQIRIRRAGRFAGHFKNEDELSVTGRITSAGRVRGHYGFSSRSGYMSGSFFARFVQGVRVRGERIFPLYGSDHHAAGVTTNLNRSGVPATEIGSIPAGVAQLPDGRIVIVDGPDVNPAVINSVTPFGIERHIGGGIQGRGLGNGGPISRARFHSPTVVAARPDGGYLISDGNGTCVRAVSPAGIITDAAGVCGISTDLRAPLGDGGPATKAHLSLSTGLAVLHDGDLLIADCGGDRVREVSAAGTITTVAGDGRDGFAGDGGPATSARLSCPNDVVVLPDGGLLIADAGNHRVREVRPDGTIETVAGGHPVTFDHGIGDGGLAVKAALPSPAALLVRPDGSFLIGDNELGMIRRVAPDGTISTIARDGPFGFDAPAIDARLGGIDQMTALSDGGIALANGITVAEIAPARTPRLLIALQTGRLRLKPDQRPTITVTATRAARLTIRVRGAHGYRRYLHASVGAGQTRVSLPRLPPGALSARFIAHAGPRVATASVSISN